MICESYISYQQKLITDSELSDITTYIKTLYPLSLNLSDISTDLIKIMSHDKKNVSGKILFSLIKGIGDSTYDVNVEEGVIINALQYYDSVVL